MPLIPSAFTAPRRCTRKRPALWPQPRLRPVAIACIVLLSVASGRAFVPGLCANLVAVPHPLHSVYGADSVLAAKRPCCAAATAPYCAPGEAQDPDAPRIPTLAVCAFCTLTIATVEPLQHVTLPAPAVHGFAPCLHHDDAGPPLRIHTPSQGRAPPTLAAYASNV